MDCSAIVLNKLLSGKDLELWSRIKLVFLDASFSSIYSAIAKFYEQYSTVPSFDELELTLREGVASRTLATLRLADNPEISAEVALAALIDSYTQNETIKHLDRFIDKLPQYDTDEIKENLASIILALDEKTLTTEGVYNMAEIMLFKNEADLARDRVHMGFNNTFDAMLAGMARQELLLIGGGVGSGKSITCSNIQVNQYEAGNSCVYFSIEMVAFEVLERNIAILANVPHGNIKKGTLTDEEMLRVIKVRADMFLDAGNLVEEFKQTRDRFKFEQSLVREKQLKPDNQMVIIDDRALSLTSLDLHIGKLKAKFGDKLTTVVVDYLNQIVVEGNGNQFDWQPQVIISKKLKELARKYDVVMVSPYQTDKEGTARFGKGILDAADIGLQMKAHAKEDNAMSFTTVKIRGSGDIACTSSINWDTLRINPISIDPPSKEEKAEGPKLKKAGKKSEDVKVDDEGANLPWNT